MDIFDKAKDIALTGAAFTVGPAIFLLVTPFIKILIALSILRNAIGISLPNLAINILSLILTYFSSQEYLENIYNLVLVDLFSEKISFSEALYKIQPLIEQFVKTHAREQDIILFANFKNTEIIDYKILLPAYFISQIVRGCAIGLALLIPFLVIDLIVAMLLLSLSMMMVPPQLLSAPLKIAFVLYADTFTTAINAVLYMN